MAMNYKNRGLSRRAHVWRCATSRLCCGYKCPTPHPINLSLRLIAVILVIGCAIMPFADQAKAQKQDKNKDVNDKPVTTMVRDGDKVITTTIFPTEAKVVKVTAVYGMGGRKLYETKTEKKYDLGPWDEIKKYSEDEARKKLVANTGYTKTEDLPQSAQRFIKQVLAVINDYRFKICDRKTANRRLMYLDISNDGIVYDRIVSNHNRQEDASKAGRKQSIPASANASTGEKKP